METQVIELEDRMRADDHYDDEVPPWGFGSLQTLTDTEPEYDVVAELHAVIEEVTGEPVESPAPRRIGFY